MTTIDRERLLADRIRRDEERWRAWTGKRCCKCRRPLEHVELPDEPERCWRCGDDGLEPYAIPNFDGDAPHDLGWIACERNDDTAQHWTDDEAALWVSPLAAWWHPVEERFLPLGTDEPVGECRIVVPMADMAAYLAPASNGCESAEHPNGYDVRVCGACGSVNAEETAWIHCNTGKTDGGEAPTDDTWCPACDAADRTAHDRGVTWIGSYLDHAAEAVAQRHPHTAPADCHVDPATGRCLGCPEVAAVASQG